MTMEYEIIEFNLNFSVKICILLHINFLFCKLFILVSYCEALFGYKHTLKNAKRNTRKECKTLSHYVVHTTETVKYFYLVLYIYMHCVHISATKKKGKEYVPLPSITFFSKFILLFQLSIKQIYSYKAAFLLRT